MLDIRLDFTFHDSSLLSHDAPPSYSLFLQKKLPDLSVDVVVEVPKSLWEVSDVSQIEQAARKSVVRIDAAARGHGGGARGSLLCLSDKDSPEWLDATMKSQDTAKECPVCFEAYDDAKRAKTGPLLWSVPCECCHWACRHCWLEISNHAVRRCPVCREDVSLALSAVFPDSACGREAARDTEVLAGLVGDGGDVWRPEPGLFGVHDVLRALCAAPPALYRAELERSDPLFAIGTRYLPRDNGVGAAASGRTLLSYLRGSDALRPGARAVLGAAHDDEGAAAWSALGSLIFVQEVYSLFQDELRRTPFASLALWRSGAHDAVESSDDDYDDDDEGSTFFVT